VSGVWTCDPRHCFGRFLPTYSGRAIEDGTARHGDCLPGTRGARTLIHQAYRRIRDHPVAARRPGNGLADHVEPVVAAPGTLCHRACVDQDGPDNYSASGEIT